jgi:NitT/TauT family transport system permease protein
MAERPVPAEPLGGTDPTVGAPVPGTGVSTEVPPATTGGAPAPASLDRTLAGLDALEGVSGGTSRSFGQRAWAATWPKLGALALILLVWQILAWVHWKPNIFQSPATVAKELRTQLGTSAFWQSVGVTAEQALIGYALVIVVGAVVGVAVARIPVLRSAIGSLITGMQTMPSVLWYPVGYMVFGVSWRAIVLMMVLSAAPAVANGFIAGIDQVPPGMLRVGRVLGARGIALERHVVLPAAFPTILGGLKQAWAFGWHALMAGEFLVLAMPLSLGGRTVNALSENEFSTVVAMMIVIILIGIVVDLGLSKLDRSVRRRYGLVDGARR